MVMTVWKNKTGKEEQIKGIGQELSCNFKRKNFRKMLVFHQKSDRDEGPSLTVSMGRIFQVWKEQSQRPWNGILARKFKEEQVDL